MAIKTKKISALIESQLPNFIVDEYPLFSKFLEKYYEAQENIGQPLDLANNILEYADINYYETNLLKENTLLTNTITASDAVITLDDGSSFPEKNGYIRINDEIVFYANRSGNVLSECSRGVSGTTTLGDLYEESSFVTTEAVSHVSGSTVYNVSNLFLYALIKSFESQYLASFPEKYLKGGVDKRTLIKNIKQFYKTKGTDASIRFIFNSIVSKDTRDVPETYNPKDFTYKASKSDWINVYALKAKVISGNPEDLIGKVVVQQESDDYGYVSATVDNVKAEGTVDGEKIWNIILAPETITGEFAISTKTRLEKELSVNDGVGKRVNVFSTIGWGKTGEILIGEETIRFEEKNITQFTIKKRGNVTYTHAVGSSVYKPVTISGSGVTLLTLGVVYNLSTTDGQPYAFTGDEIEVSNPGFETSDPKIVRTGTNQTRWILNQNLPINCPTVPSVAAALGQTSTDVSAIFADDQYYYITSSSYPSYRILDGSTVTQTVKDQKILRLIRKESTRTTEKYKTPKTDVGILLNGVRVYSHRDPDSIRFGKLEQIRPETQGSGYTKAPFVLIDGAPNKARAVLSGSVVERYIVDTNDTFPRTPAIEVTSGRGASVRAVVTGDKVTSLVIEEPGEFYSSPPLVRITDRNGKGRFAEFLSIVDTDGKLIGFDKIAEGSFYNQETIRVDIIPVGSGATATGLLKEWNFNRFEKLKSNLDTEYGYVFKNFTSTLEYGYGHVGNPKALRVALNDNLGPSGLEPQVKVHSPIIGFAYDGNPIYGPFAHENPLNQQSPIVRMTSSYSRNGSRSDGPSLSQYPLGSFVNDYTYKHKSGSLDENNGRFCVTPDYPEGVYAYFLTIDSNQVPKYPYFIGENFYSLPVDSNYNSDINQNDIPKASKRFYIPGMPRNGEGVFAKIAEVKSGTIDNIIVDGSSDNFSVNSKLYFDNRGSEGSEAEALVNSLKGKPVQYLDSYENKVVKLTTIQNAYLFTDDTLRQPSSGASGVIVGEVRNDNEIVLKNVVGTFDNTGTFSADIKTFFILLDQDSSYTKGAILSLTDGINPPAATGEVLNGTSQQNVVEIKVLSGDWFQFDQGEYFLQSNNFFNTSGTRAVTLTSLSDNLNPFEVNQSVALIETDGDHGLGINDKVTINIFPDDATKTKEYYVRKRLYQDVVFKAPTYSSEIEDTGIGRFQILNGGADYSQGTYNNVPLTGGSGEGATASITVSSLGVVSSIVIQNQGSGYRKADYLGVDDSSLERSVASSSTSRLTLYIDHIGFAAGATKLNVNSSTGLAEGDLVKIGEEIIEVTSIEGKELTVIRGREGSADKDHYNSQPVSLYKPKFNFSDGFQVGTENTSGYILSYDPETQKATFVFNYEVQKSNAQDIKVSTTFFDSSTPSRLVSIKTADPIDYKFEFSEDNVDFIPNPNIEVQEFYRYKFDTSHPSLTGTYFDLSPSKNYNVITVEKLTTVVLPGNTGAFTEVKFGFGSRLATNDYTTKVGTDFTNFYYFDKNGIVNSEEKYLKLITDPLQGEKEVIYVTPNRFVYNVTSVPLWDGSGDITYTTKGQFCVGEINDIKITNLGLNYKKVPTIIGADPNPNFKARATVLFDESTNTIVGIRTDNKGSNYSSPKVVIIDGNGIDAEFDVVVRNGEIFSITVKNSGTGYTYAPIVEIIESDVEAYVDSKTIGIPQSVNIIRNGGAFHLDKTVSSKFTSKYTVSLKNPSGTFQRGEIVIQVIGNTEVSRSIVSEFRSGSNLLKLEKVSGILREGVEISGLISRAAGTINSVFVSSFSEKITAFYDNIGYYKSDRGKLGVSNQRIIDSFFYQDYSYVVKSKTPIDQWRELIKSTTHPAGFKLFGQVDIETTAESTMPVEMPKSSHFSVIQLWDPEKNKITIQNTRRTVTQTIQKVENQRIIKGIGSASTSEFNFNESRAFTFRIYNPTPGFYDDIIADGKPWWYKNPFTGYYDSDSILQGRTVFQLRSDADLPFTPFSAKNMVVTLDGVLQEPEVAYTVSGDNITFSQPPLGPYQKLTGNNLNELTDYNGVTFYGRYFNFKDNQYNTRYFKKIRNIFQRNGRWLDSANQIERNRTFIVEECIGYGRSKYPTLDWSTKQDDYERDLGYILDAYEHDIRFGGNVKTVDFTTIFNQNDDYAYITDNKNESLGIFKYATNLAKLAIRNWDVVENNVTYIQGSRQVTVQDTNRLAVGMHISSGRAFSKDTKIVSIDSNTQITLSHAALANSGGGGGAPAGNTPLSGSTSGNFTLPTNTGVVEPGNTFAVTPGDELIAPVSFSGSDTATFYMSGINSGTYYDASNLIFQNKQYLQEEISEYIYATYSLPQGDKAKCSRDLGYLIDAIVYHLRLGGNEKVVEFARLYYTNAGYPYGENLTYINRTAEETTAAIDAWEKLGEKMILAMRNSLGAGTYTSITPYTDPGIAVDSVVPVCNEVASSIDSMITIVKDILANGTGAVDSVGINVNKSGYWTDTKTYTNYNIIPDPSLPAQECDDVISSVDSLYNNVEDILNETSAVRTLPDYVDGENKVFEMYWEDGSEVNTEEDEDLFITINAVLQRPKYTATYPGEDAYYIDRTTIPNKLVFDVAPIWDQDFGAKNIGEPTAVEKIVGIGVGNYKRLTIDYNLVDGVKTGPFLILDVEDSTVQSIEDKEYLYVFLDGVLQREGFSYEISGPNIYFNVPIQKEMKIDMRYLYGRDVGQILNIYNFSPDNFYARSIVNLDVTSGLTELLNYYWMGDRVNFPIQAYQIKADGTYNTLGEVSDFYAVGNNLSFRVFGFKYQIDESLSITFGVRSLYSYNTTITFENPVVTYDVDEYGKLNLFDNNQKWAGTVLSKSYRDPFVNLATGDSIRVEGEDKFRRIKKIPRTAFSKEERFQQQVSNSIYSSVDVERYNGITRGEGLSVVAILEYQVDENGNKIPTGRIERLEWNRRNFNPITQSTAYQYFTAPILNFIPQDGNGGGARAHVLVDPYKGNIISIDLLDSGSGYTKAPKVEVSRRYDILKERGVGVSLIKIGVNPIVDNGGFTVFSTINFLGLPEPQAVSTTAIILDSVVDSNIVIEEEIQLNRTDLNQTKITEKGKTISRRSTEAEPNILDLFTQTNQYLSQISGRVTDVISSSVLTANRQITTTVSEIINNTALSNVNYYETGAYLQVDFLIGDTILYVGDTSKFKSNGYLLVGDEIVRYYRKLGDRFLKIQRAQQNTTEKDWLAGTFLRQIPDPVSVAYAGVALVESESQVVSLPAASSVGKTERETERQIITPDVKVVSSSVNVFGLEIQPILETESISSVLFRYDTTFEVGAENIISEYNTITTEIQVSSQLQIIESQFNVRKDSLEVLLFTPPSGVVDSFEEQIQVTNPIKQRSGIFVSLDDPRLVLKRDLSIVSILNESESLAISSYEKTNVGPTIGSWSYLALDDGTANVSAFTIQEITAAYPSLSLLDFEKRSKSSYTLKGDYFNFANASIQDPRAQYVQTTDNFGTHGYLDLIEENMTIEVSESIDYFPESGYLYIGQSSEYFGAIYQDKWGIVSYTGKSGKTFTGCNGVRWNHQTLLPNATIIPYSID